MDHFQREVKILPPPPPSKKSLHFQQLSHSQQFRMGVKISLIVLKRSVVIWNDILAVL